MKETHFRQLDRALGSLTPLHSSHTTGGPYQHRFQQGSCRVCGALEGTIAGCPASVTLQTMEDHRALHRKPA